eukprot:4443814-Pyramimonas_sp.AAC.1
MNRGGGGGGVPLAVVIEPCDRPAFDGHHELRPRDVDSVVLELARFLDEKLRVPDELISNPLFDRGAASEKEPAHRG